MAKDMHRHDETFFEILEYLESKIEVRNPRNYMFQGKLKFQFVFNEKIFEIFCKSVKLTLKNVTSEYIIKNVKFECEDNYSDGLDIKDTLDNIIITIKDYAK